MIEIPLRNKRQEVLAVALIDDEDADQATRRWFLDGSYAVRVEQRNGQKTKLYLHREIMKLSRGDGLEVDHKNLNKLDNQRRNLRVVTRHQQMQNIPAIGGTSPHRGVSWVQKRQRWLSCAQLNNKFHHLGYFDREEDAAAAASAFRREHMPFSEADAA